MKVILAYSGGLDTSVLVRWIKDYYSAEVITFAADVGQEDVSVGIVHLLDFVVLKGVLEILFRVLTIYHLDVVAVHSRSLFDELK